jgi:hypothetical protein
MPVVIKEAKSSFANLQPYLRHSNFMKAVIILFIILLSACSGNTTNIAKDKNSIQQLTTPGSGNLKHDNSVIYVTPDSLIVKGKEQISYKFNVDTSGYYLKTIIVYSRNLPIQNIIVEKIIEGREFSLIDWNFDGYKDIAVLDNCGSGGCSYLIWNYSKETGQYCYNEDLSEILGLEIDNISKHIIFHYRAGWSEESWDSLQYVNDKLKFVKGLRIERWNDEAGNEWVKYTRKKKDQDQITVMIDSAIVKNN